MHGQSKISSCPSGNDPPSPTIFLPLHSYTNRTYILHFRPFIGFHAKLNKIAEMHFTLWSHLYPESFWTFSGKILVKSLIRLTKNIIKFYRHVTHFSDVIYEKFSFNFDKRLDFCAVFKIAFWLSSRGNLRLCRVHKTFTIK